MKKTNLKTKILSKIETGEVKMKPKFWFVLREKMLEGGWLLITLGGAISLAATAYLLELLNPKELMEFGDIGREVVVKKFPYWGLLATGVLLGLSILTLPKVGDNYKKGVAKTVLVSSIVLVAAALILTWLRMEVTGEL